MKRLSTAGERKPRGELVHRARGFRYRQASQPPQVTIPEALPALVNATGAGVGAEYHPLTMVPRVLTYMPSSAKALLDAVDSL